MAAIDRRTFLRTGLFGVGASLLGPMAFLRLARAQPLPADASVLVVLELSGGNDGLSTVIPYGDDAYHKVRRQTRLTAADVLKVSDYIGLNPRLKALWPVYDRGDLAIVQGCSYPNPNRSHFKSMDIWHAASAEGRRLGTGWLGRAVDAMHPDEDDPDLLAALGGDVPFAMAAARHKPVAFTSPGQYRWRGLEVIEDEFEALNCEECEAPREGASAGAGEGGAGGAGSPAPAVAGGGAATGPGSNRDFLHKVAASARASSDRMRKAAAGYKARVPYPRGRLGQALGLVVGLIAGGLPTRVFYLSVGGFDTHTNQRGRHDNLMGSVADASAAFLDDLAKHGLADRVTLLAFSEFGRRVEENASGGTDHGVAGPMLLAGPKVNGGVHGAHPSLTDLDKGDLKMTTDFRSVYASVLDQWLKAPSRDVLGDAFAHLPLFAAAREGAGF